MTRAKRKPTIEPLGDLTVSQSTQAPLPSIEQVGNVPATIPPRQRRQLQPSERNLGGNTYSTKVYAPTFAQPIIKKGVKGRDTWANTALVLVDRSLKAAQTYGKKDFNALYRLVLSAGIAFDKAFPQQQQPLGGNLVIQLFGSLGADTARRILEPAHPVIDITPLPVSITMGSEADAQAEAEPQPTGGIPTTNSVDDIT